MFSSSFRRSLRPLAGAAALAPCVVLREKYVSCEAAPKTFQSATCTKNEPHTSDTRLITFKIENPPWTSKSAIANVLIKAEVDAKQESGCCACCKCPPPCGCPKTSNGCCACCKCPDTCGCPKQAVAVKKEEGCCACCKCPPPCGCPKTSNGCCACCKCTDTCGCPKTVAAAAKEEGCCACCKCPPPCGCPKTSNGCCACCKCLDKCGCPKKEAPSSSSVARPYNPLSVDTYSDFTLLVKKYQGAKMGTKLHSLKPGDKVEMKGPNQQWTYKQGAYDEYCMIAGGTGITPLMQATDYILGHGDAKVKMVTFNKTPADVLLKEQLESLAESYPGRLSVVHYVEGGEGYQRAGCKQASKCCMPRTLKEECPKPGSCLIMVCGPKAMTEAVAGAKTPDFKQGEVGGHLKELGYESKHVWKV